MKIGILTVHSQINYGGVLQAYALQKFLNAQGYDAEIIDYWCSRANGELTGGMLSQRGVSFNLLRRVVVQFLKNGFIAAEITRRRRTIQFLNRFVKKSEMVYRDAGELEKISGYDCYIVGSDQIWNSNWHGTPNPFLLGFLDATCKRISYAASFGVKSIPDERCAEYSSALSKFSRISVREKEGIEIVRGLTGIEAQWVLDPTLLLNGHDWREICGTADSDKPYIFCYWLGDLSTVFKLLLKLAKKRGETVCLYGNPHLLASSYGRIISIVVRFLFLLHPRIRCCFDAGPIEFLRGIAGASAVVSDSFHAMMFACIFEKPFKIFVNSCSHRKGMSARLLDFAKMFDLESGVEVDLPDSEIVLAEPDYKGVLKQMDAHCESSLKFLYNSI